VRGADQPKRTHALATAPPPCTGQLLGSGGAVSREKSQIKLSSFSGPPTRILKAAGLLIILHSERTKKNLPQSRLSSERQTRRGGEEGVCQEPR
jgi:hypothetical protein